MPAPALTITGTLQDIFGNVDDDASIVIQLCGYGSQVPRVSGTALLAKTAPIAIDCPAGTFSTKIYGNDVILPGGTYYTIQLLDDNGNVVQVNAYKFTGSGTVNVSTLTPYTPFVPAPTPAPQPGALYVVVAFLFNAVFNALNTAGIITFDMTLTGDLTAPTLTGLTPGQFINFVFQQDGTGGHAVTPPAQVYGMGVPDTTPNAISSQLFWVRGDGNVYNLGPMNTN